MTDKKMMRYLDRKCYFISDGTKYFGIIDCVFQEEDKVFIHLIKYPDEYVELPINRVTLVA